MDSNLRTFHSNGFWDKTGAAVSWVCAIHCLVLPFALSALPFLGLSFLLDERIEWLIIAFSVVVALVSLLPAYLHRHRQKNVLVSFCSGIGLIIAAHILFEENLVLKIPFILGGAFFVSAAHLINYRACRKCKKCCGSEAC